MLIGKKLEYKLVKEVAEKIPEEIEPITDLRASAEYRKAMAHTLTRRLITECFDELTK